ncbi:MAG: hypothetical protein ACP5UH_03065 [Candidatus Micrarchaeia archaeon]
MSTYVEAAAPGKVLWLGGYSVLEGNVGLVTTVDAKVHVSAETIPGNKLVIEAPMVNSSIGGKIEEDGSIIINTVPELTLLVKSIEIALKYAVALGGKATGLHIKTRNDALMTYRVVRSKNGTKVVKSGLGSSAALTVATASSILELFGGYDREKVHRIAQLSHSVATEKIGSGFDIAAATFGTIIYQRYSPSLLKGFPEKYTPADVRKYIEMGWDYKIKKTEFPKAFTPVFAHFKDESAITTSMIKSVNKFKDEHPERYRQIMEEIKTGDEEAIKALNGINTDAAAKHYMELFREGFERSRRAMKLLGEESSTSIEPDDCTTLIEESKKHGAYVAKLPGSGGKDSIAALALSPDDAEKLKNFWNSIDELEVLDLKIADGGLSFTQSVNC